MSTLFFYLNGKATHLDNVDPAMRLIDYLRSESVGLTGTKKSCDDGGSGASTVMLSTYEPARDNVSHRAVDSTLYPMGALDGKAVTTIEGLGGIKTEISRVQYRIAAENGSQCGYCTPGFVMTMYSFLAAKGGRKVSKKEIEELFSGNICRCTGYRPILQAMKSFAHDWTTKDQDETMPCKTGAYDFEVYDNIPDRFPGQLRKKTRALHLKYKDIDWFRPSGLEDLYRLIKRHGQAPGLQLVNGNTFPLHGAKTLIDISQLEEIKKIGMEKDSLVIGAGVTYNEFIRFLQPLTEKKKSKPFLYILKEFISVAGRVSGHVIRNVATFGGDTVRLARDTSCVSGPSDMCTLLLALGTRLTAKTDGADPDEKPRLLPLSEFIEKYKSYRLPVVLSYHVPLQREKEVVGTYKTARRKQNDFAIVNGALRVRFDGGHTVGETALVFGIGGVATFRAAGTEAYLKGKPWNPDTLAGVLPILKKEAAAVAAQVDKSPADPASGTYDGISMEYKLGLVESFFYKFFLHTAEKTAPGSVAPEYLSAARAMERGISRGTQKYRRYPEEYPVNEPLVNRSAFKQATGEAIYTRDMPLPARGLHAAIVPTTRAAGSFSYIHPQTGRFIAGDDLINLLQERFAGFIDFICAGNMPDNCQNEQQNEAFLGKPEHLFCLPENVESFGQAIGLAVAESEKTALDAASFIRDDCISYSEKDGEPVLTIEESIKKSRSQKLEMGIIKREGSCFDWVGKQGGQKVKAASGGSEYLCEIIEGQQVTGGQSHFYMETQGTVVKPGEGMDITVHPASQSPLMVRQFITHTLGVQVHANNVDVVIKRVGGGFGGKTDRSAFLASSAALAAWKHHRPVKLVVPRDIDTAVVGNRDPFLGRFSVAVATGEGNPKARGKLVGLSTDFFSDTGSHFGCSIYVMQSAQLRGDSAYMAPNYRSTGTLCRTNKATNTAFRSFGMIQAALILEEAIEKAAHTIGMPAEEIREKNLYRLGDTTPWGQKLNYCYMREVWRHLLKVSDFKKRHRRVLEFNKKNRWRKRGICAIPIKYGMGFNVGFEAQGGALISIYESDGTVLVQQGGVELGQGLMTKIAQIAAESLNIPLDKVKMDDTNTYVIANPTSTEASSGTTYNGSAVRKAGLLMRKRLEDFCRQCKDFKGVEWCKKNGINYWDYPEGWQAEVIDPSSGKSIMMWKLVIAQAYHHRVDLSVHALYRNEGLESADMNSNQFSGFVYSAACSEVEVDILTGETNILRSDIVYDMGKSLNPAIDVGQVEGAFVMGIGNVLTEELVYDDAGRLKTTNFGGYKVPSAGTVPEQLNVDLFPREEAPEAPENPYLIMAAKEVGEPPLVLASTVFFAIKRAILASRVERGNNQWFELQSPATVNRIREACMVDAEEMKT